MSARTHYRIDLASKWAIAASAFAGLGFFLLCVYYFGFTNLVDCGFGEVLFSMLLPMAVMAAVVVMVRVIHYDTASVFGAMGTVYSLLMVIRTFFYGSVLNTIIAIVWYLLVAIVCIAVITGKLTDCTYLAVAFFVPAIVRLIFIDIFKYLFSLSLIAFIPEAAALCGLAAFGMIACCMNAIPVKRTVKQS